jgi:regulator of sigma E protease
VSWFLAFAGFSALIILHEFGHFVAAKAVGMRVERFALFFPPLLFKVRRGETEYGIGAVPLGGYVKITGMNPEEKVPEEVAHRAYYRQAVWKRVVVIAAGPAVNLVLAFVILWAVILSQGLSQQALGVYTVERGSPAQSALRVNDRILAVDGHRVFQPHPSDSQFVKEVGVTARLVNAHACPGTPVAACVAATPVHLTVQRGSRSVDVTVRPRYDAALKRMRLGFGFGLHRYYGPAGALGQSASTLWSVATGTVNAVVTRFTSPNDHRLLGTVGAFETTRQAVTFGVADALWVLGIISFSLALINLFPFLPLDGGHIFWALAEKLRGRAVSFATMQRASLVGLVLVVYFAVVGLSSYIYHLQNGGFGR